MPLIQYYECGLTKQLFTSPFHSQQFASVHYMLEISITFTCVHQLTYLDIKLHPTFVRPVPNHV